MLGSMHAQAHIGSDAERADVQGSTVRTRHPVAVNIDQGLNGLDKILRRDGGHAQTVSRIVETVSVAVGAEQLDLALGGAVGLHALENFLGVVEHGGSRVHFPRAVGDDTGIVPALTGGIVHHEHMVAEDLAKAQLRLVLRFLFRMFGFNNFNIQHDLHSPLYFQARLAAQQSADDG